MTVENREKAAQLFCRVQGEIMEPESERARVKVPSRRHGSDGGTFLFRDSVFPGQQLRQTPIWPPQCPV